MLSKILNNVKIDKVCIFKRMVPVICLIVAIFVAEGGLAFLVCRKSFAPVLGFLFLNCALCVVVFKTTKFKDRRALQVLIDTALGEKENYKRLSEEAFMAIATAIDVNEPSTAGHSQRVANYSKEIAERLGMNDEEAWNVFYAGLLHDTGKLGIDNQIIKKPGPLTDEEYEEIKKHPELGAKILGGISASADLAAAAKYHHERPDGKGYPDGTTSAPLIGRIVAVADAYDAMTSRRSYRDALPQEVVREEIKKGVGTQFDPVIAKVMLDMIDSDVKYTMRQTEYNETLHYKSSQKGENNDGQGRS